MKSNQITSAQRQGISEERFNNGINSIAQSLLKGVTATVIEKRNDAINTVRSFNQKGVDALRQSIERSKNNG